MASRSWNAPTENSTVNTPCASKNCCRPARASRKQEINMPEDITQTIAEDDWAAAMAEQAAPATPSPAVFQDLSGTAASGGLAKDIDFILDIPVLLTVELGRTKIAIKNLLQLAQGSV